MGAAPAALGRGYSRHPPAAATVRVRVRARARVRVGVGARVRGRVRGRGSTCRKPPAKMMRSRQPACVA